MVATITAVWDQIASDWSSTTPPNRTAVTYQRATSKSVQDGTAGDRNFWFEVVPGGRAINMESTADTRVLWRFLARLMLSSAGRDVEDMGEAIVNEGNLLARRVENRTSWPAGVWEVTGPAWRGQENRSTGDVVLVLEIEALCGESD